MFFYSGLVSSRREMKGSATRHCRALVGKPSLLETVPTVRRHQSVEEKTGSRFRGCHFPRLKFNTFWDSPSMNFPSLVPQFPQPSVSHRRRLAIDAGWHRACSRGTTATRIPGCPWSYSSSEELARTPLGSLSHRRRLAPDVR